VAWRGRGSHDGGATRGGKTHSVFGLDEGVVDGNDLDLGVLDGVAEDDTANAAETVDANLDGSHFACAWEVVSGRGRQRQRQQRKAAGKLAQ